MKTFTSPYPLPDADGPPPDGVISWEISLSIGLVRRIKAHLDVDLMRPSDPFGPRGLPLIQMLHADLELFVNVLWMCCQKQAQQLQINEEQFAALLDDQPFQDCRAAWWEEWIGFFERAGVLEQAATIRKQIECVQAAATKILGVPVEAFMTDVNAAIDQMTHGTSSTSSPASSALTPNP